MKPIHSVQDPWNPLLQQQALQHYVVTADQMRAIESQLFKAGMPVAALMEKVAGRLAQWIHSKYSLVQFPRVGVLVGPGHNGGDALVVARELFHRGYAVQVYCPFSHLKDLTVHHCSYARYLGIPVGDDIAPLQQTDVIVDGVFGFGLERPIQGAIAQAIDQVNRWSIPVVSVDLPSGIHTDTGEVLGTAIRASHTLCLGLWKLGLLQDTALEAVGEAELIDFDLPESAIAAVLGTTPARQRITPQMALAALPLQRSPLTHKYRQGHVLVIGGSRRYGGAVLLAALGARASGVGMVTVAVPESLKVDLTPQLPEALLVGCPETETGAIAQLPAELMGQSYDAIACGPGLTRSATALLKDILICSCPLVLDADGLNMLSELNPQAQLSQRLALTVLTPHWGEFTRLFPDLADPETGDRTALAQVAAQSCGAMVVLKGARVVTASSQGSIWINPTSTPALARGGSGDVLTGMIGGLLAQAVQQNTPLADCVWSAVWWHAQAGQFAAHHRTILGVDALTLAQLLIPALHSVQSQILKSPQ
jgi:NAD(P)H-hydrate epimerase